MRYSIRKVVCRLLSFILFAVILASCKEDIDKDLAISSKPTITEFIQQNPSRFSEIGKLFERVKLGNKKDGSTLASVLSCRGVYTVFLPNNQGVAKYLEEHGCATVEELPDSLAELVTYSCIIDNHGNTSYSEAEFPTPGSFAQGDLNNRNLTCAQVVTEDQSTQYLISGTATTVETDIELSNGTVHEVDGVISPSYLSVYELVRNADNMHIMSRLLEMPVGMQPFHNLRETSLMRRYRTKPRKTALVTTSTKFMYTQTNASSIVTQDSLKLTPCSKTVKRKGAGDCLPRRLTKKAS